MSFPGLPWRLKGEMLQTVRLVSVAAARKFVPDDVRILHVLPGFTLGGLTLARYRPGSTLSYHELIATCALTFRGTAVGAWISHIYVDDPRSLRAGRRMFGLPKEMAAFSWEDETVSVRQRGRLLCAAHWTARDGWLPVPLGIPVLGTVDGDRRHFRAEGEALVRPARARLHVSDAAPFLPLGLEGASMAFCTDDLDLRFADVKVLA
ncbi:MAG: hypothetical protein FJX76_11745 [Armatimonadetes bacterium]|nr:hypothetical protein [Armatimonadota bacterium]